MDPFPLAPSRSRASIAEQTLSAASSKTPTGAGSTDGDRGRRLGRRVGQVVYYALVASIAGAATLQVLDRAFFVEQAATPYGSCEEGLRALHEAVSRGRVAARTAPPEDADALGEAALRRYRAAVTPTWRHRDGVAALCRAEPELRRALDAIERLRYAEEHDVRSQAAELGPLRRRVQRIVRTRLTEVSSP